INNEKFIIEHSKDGIQFSQVGSVQSQNKATSLQEYTYEHKDVEAGQHYYRLKQVDLDGKYSYSNIESVKIKSVPNETIIFPNPTTGLVYLFGDSDVSYEIINSAGVNVAAGKANQSTIQMDQLPSGLYVILMKNEY